MKDLNSRAAQLIRERCSNESSLLEFADFIGGVIDVDVQGYYANLESSNVRMSWWPLTDR